MIFALIEHGGKEQLCCVDKIGKRAFLTEEFFKSDLQELCIGSNEVEKIPETMDEFIRRYDALWADDMALFYGSNPALGISLDPKREWEPLTKLDEAWSPLVETRGLGLLE